MNDILLLLSFFHILIITNFRPTPLQRRAVCETVWEEWERAGDAM